MQNKSGKKIEKTRFLIDVSEHSGAINWTEFDRNRFSFVYLKASEGIDLVDSAFQNHWLELKRLGIPRGAYHFFVTEDDPVVQAEFFIQTVGDDHGELLPVLDIELIGHGTRGDLAKKVRIFLELVEKKYRVKPIIYTSPNFWDKHIRSDFSAYPLWVAEYGVDKPRLPHGWTGWMIWQYKENLALDWVEKGADISRVHSDMDKILNVQNGH